MSPTLILTIFLFFAGIFTLFCAFAKYEWFLSDEDLQETLIYRIIGKKGIRIFFFAIAGICIAWGTARIVNPPREIPSEFLFDIAKPDGIDLTTEDALEKLKAVDSINSLKQKDGKWASFESNLLAASEFFTDARDAAAAGPDFDKGFNLRSLRIDGAKVEGRIVYFDPDYVVCNNWLFSKNPLSSAEFVMVICNEDTSEEGTLRLLFARKGSAWYDKLTDF